MSESNHRDGIGCLKAVGDSLLDHGIGSVKQENDADSLDVYCADETMIRSGLSSKGDLSARVKRPKYSNLTLSR